MVLRVGKELAVSGGSTIVLKWRPYKVALDPLSDFI